MVPDDRKLKRLIGAASMYYKDNMLQSEIAGVMGISRPMVSNTAEARECGVVTITINEAGSAQELLAGRRVTALLPEAGICGAVKRFFHPGRKQLSGPEGFYILARRA